MKIDELGRLAPDRIRSYLEGGIPDELDAEIESLVAPALAGGWSELRSRVTPGHHLVLQLFAERVAALAVRRGRPGLLETALAALALGGLDQGSREALLIVPLVYRSAELIGADPDALFENVAERVGDDAAETLRAFPQRADRSIRSMGYEEGADEDGFRYRRTW